MDDAQHAYLAIRLNLNLKNISFDFWPKGRTEVMQLILHNILNKQQR